MKGIKRLFALFSIFILLMSVFTTYGIGSVIVNAADLKGIGLSSDSPTMKNDGTKVPIDSNLTITEIDDDLDGASVVIDNFKTGDKLHFNNTDNIKGDFNEASGVLRLSGLASAEEYQAALRSVHYSTTSTDLSDRTFTYNLGSALSYNGHYYEFIEASNIRWTDARVAAEERTFFGRKGYLATITSQGENDFVKEKTNGIGWIGASDHYLELNKVLGTNYTNQSQAEGQWYWVTGPEAGTQFWSGDQMGSPVGDQYTNWYNHEEPNNSSGEHYAHILGPEGPFWTNDPDPTGFGKWNDFPDFLPGHVKGYIVEYGGMDGDIENITISTSKVINVGEPTPLDKVNAAKDTEDISAMIEALLDPKLGLDPEIEFSDWSDGIQAAVADIVVNIIEGQYESKEQIEYVIKLAFTPILAHDDPELSSIKKKINDFFTGFQNIKTVFSNEDGLEVYSQLGEKFVTMSDIDKEIFTFRTKLYVLRDQIPVTDYFSSLTATFSMYHPINRVTEQIKMYNALVHLRLYQKESEEYNAMNPTIPMDEFPLNLKKIDNIDYHSYQDLAQWMLDKRPQGGYTTFEEIQKTFDLFFAPSAPTVTADDVNNKIQGANETMEYSTDDGQTWISYDPDNAPTFTGNVTVLVRVKAYGDIPAGEITTLTFTTNPAPPNNGGGGSTPTTEQIVVDVDGEDGTNLAKTPITRTTEPDGTVKDKVSLSETIAKETVEKAKENGVDTARIIIPDADDKVSEVVVEIPKAALRQLNDGNMKLEIATNNAVISIPVTSISDFNDDLYFRIVPIKSEEEKKKVEERAKTEEVVKGQTIQLLGRPMEIETNMQNREVSIILPLKDSLPTDPTKRQEILNNLGVFIEHSDGTKELIQGTIVKMADGSEGIQFTVAKFSTFTILHVEGLSKAHHIQRLLIRSDDQVLYNPQGKVHRKLIRNEGIRVYKVEADRYQVGGGYYIMKNKVNLDYLGHVHSKTKTMYMYTPDGKKIYRKIPVGTNARVYSIEKGRYQVGGGYYIIPADHIQFDR